jgi:uncharacterized spore protein YtfJ
MTDEVEFTYKKQPTEGISQGMAAAEETLNKFLSTADVSAAYGQPIRKGETLIIPTAEVVSIMGFGIGDGDGNGKEGQVMKSGGGGGGGKTFSRPVAVIIVGPEGVRVAPVFDITKVLLAALTALGFMFSTLLRMQSRR